MRLFSLIFVTLFATLTSALAVELGDDGLHKPAWLEDTFLDLREDLETANEQGKRLMIVWEQRGCIYCNEMHNVVFPEPMIDKLITENFYVVQLNLFGDKEVTDFDGTVMSEKKMAVRWGVVFTPTMMFMTDKMPDAVMAPQVTVMTMPGAFEKWTTRSIMLWVTEKGYETDEHFQKFHARKLEEGLAAERG